jgi:ubiquinone/menaquinone biosynthesis C-methylase UbiE
MTQTESVQHEKAGIFSAFNDVAPRYDLLSGLNPGYRKHLRWSAERLGLEREGEGSRILDLCCGTGLSTEPLVQLYPKASITGLDLSSGMLEKARKKESLRSVTFVCGNGMEPAASGVKGPLDAVLMAYGIRNMPDADACLANVIELLAPGGVICFHEYSVADSRWSRAVWNAVTFGIVIPLAFVTTGSTEIFRYLRRSVLEFDGRRAFEARLERAGFTSVETLPMDGWQRGVVHTFRARRPVQSS